MEEHVVLVDKEDVPIGAMEKMEAHEKGLLHRAFSVFIFNTAGEMLIHKRALSKYHSGGLWTNACCSHPRVGETTLQAAHRRLMEEMGFDTPLEEVFSFTYQSPLDKGMIEYEFDHVLIGTYEGPFNLNPEEVAEAKYVSLKTLVEEVQNNSDHYTVWFKIALERVCDHLNYSKTT